MLEADTVKELNQIEQRLARAWEQSDRETIESILASDWTVIDISGRVLTKLELLQESFGSGDRRVDAVTIDEVQVRLLDNVAVVTGRTVAEGAYHGQDMRVVLRFTDAFTKRDGRWQVVSSQGTPVAQ
jgi:ketosteroid isomerase-like protein